VNVGVFEEVAVRTLRGELMLGRSREQSTFCRGRERMSVVWIVNDSYKLSASAVTYCPAVCMGVESPGGPLGRHFLKKVHFQFTSKTFL